MLVRVEVCCAGVDLESISGTQLVSPKKQRAWRVKTVLMGWGRAGNERRG